MQKIREKFIRQFKDKCSVNNYDLVSHGSDLFPKIQILKLFKKPIDSKIIGILFAETKNDIINLFNFSKQNNVPVIPFGAGSGVMGGTIPVKPSIIIDLKKMDRILEIDEQNLLATAQAGIIGKELEDILNDHGFTSGHFPSSIYCSTLGGYAATRSAGQYSSKYGKFEDIVFGITVITPDHGEITINRKTEQEAGTNFLDLFIGSEGTLGVITSVTIKIKPTPTFLKFNAFSLPSVKDGIKVMQQIMQSGLKPNVLRLYDPFDSMIALNGTREKQTLKPFKLFSIISDYFSEVTGTVQREAIFRILERPELANTLINKFLHRVILIVGFEGDKEHVNFDIEKTAQITLKLKALNLGEKPGLHWYKHRYSVSFKQSPIFYAKSFVDTMEVATTWDNIYNLYKKVKKAISPNAFIMAHFSHAYTDGCSIYFTFAGAKREEQDFLNLYNTIWKNGLTAVAMNQGAISHHHGIGILKNRFLGLDLKNINSLFMQVKNYFDSQHLCNPEKLWDFK